MLYEDNTEIVSPTEIFQNKQKVSSNSETLSPNLISNFQVYILSTISAGKQIRLW